MNAAAALSVIRPINNLRKDRLSWLAEQSRLVSLKKNEVLFRRGEEIRLYFGVVEGSLELVFPSPDARQPRVLAIVRKGDLFCDVPAILHTPQLVSAIAMGPSTVARIPAEAIGQIMAQDCDFAAAMLEHLATASQHLVQEIEDLTTRNAMQRVVCYLLRHGPKVASKSFEMTLPASKKAVASQLNLSQETFSRVLHQFAERGLVRIEGRILTVLDRDRLGAMMGAA